jgi:molybdopterin synthase catalytic subunit
MAVVLAHQDFQPLVELQGFQAGMGKGSYGACTTFIGSLRDFNDNLSVQSMTLEYYPGMTEKQLERIADQARADWEALDVLIVHRVGEIDPGEPIVLTAAWAVHRDAAFGACRQMIDKLKTEAPFWKKEQVSGGARWI